MEAIDAWVDQYIEQKKAARYSKPTVIPKWLRPRCGAKTRSGLPCKALAVWGRVNNKPRNGHCRMHGGLSTEPKTEERKRISLRNLVQYQKNIRRKLIKEK